MIRESRSAGLLKERSTKFLVGEETSCLCYCEATRVYPSLGGLSSLVDEDKVGVERIAIQSYCNAGRTAEGYS